MLSFKNVNVDFKKDKNKIIVLWLYQIVLKPIFEVIIFREIRNQTYRDLI